MSDTVTLNWVHILCILLYCIPQPSHITHLFKANPNDASCTFYMITAPSTTVHFTVQWLSVKVFIDMLQQDIWDVVVPHS